jgi:uncharacterized membrane protein YkoI
MKQSTRTKFVVAAVVTAATAVVGIGIANAVGDDDDRAITGADLDRATSAALAETGGGRVTGTETGDEESLYEVEVTLEDGRQVDVQLDRDFAVVSTDTDREDADDDDRALTDADRQRAEEAALAEAGGGRVTEAEADDGGYDVEVTLDDGSQVDVHLDGDFRVVSTEAEHDDD